MKATAGTFRVSGFGFRAPAAGFSLPEMTVSMAASVIILGALLLSSLSIQKSLHGSEVYAGSYSDQRRVIDYLGRDLRRAVGVAATDAAGAPQPLIDRTVDVSERATIVLTLPGYYKSNAPAAGDFDEALPVVVAQNRPTYGTPSGAAPTVEVTYRKVYISRERCVCFVRREAGTDDVIVRPAEDLFLQVSLGRDGRTGLVKVWFRSAFSGPRPLVSTFDELMLRNLRLDSSS